MGLKKKSEDNDTAATILSSSGLFSSSIHCTYYSVLQLCSHLIQTVDGQKIEDLRVKYSSSTDKGTIGSHQLIRKEVLSKVNFARKKSNDSRIDYTYFNNNFNALKSLREQSDYEDVLMSKAEAEDAASKANRLKVIIKKIYTK